MPNPDPAPDPRAQHAPARARRGAASSRWIASRCWRPGPLLAAAALTADDPALARARRAHCAAPRFELGARARAWLAALRQRAKRPRA